MTTFDIIAAVNDDTVLTKNLERSAVLLEPDVTFRAQRGYANAGKAYNEAMRLSTADVAVIVHQDVYLPAAWSTRVRSILKNLEVVDPDWAVLGLYGVTKAQRHVGYVWSSGLNRILGEPFEAPMPVDSVDELLILLRRSSGLQFDENLPGFHLYGTDIVQTAFATGFSAYAICAPVIHNSRSIQYLPRSYLDSHDYVRNKWRHQLPIQNCVAAIVNSPVTRLRRRARSWIGEFQHRSTGRMSLDPHLDCVELSRKLGFEEFDRKDQSLLAGTT